MRNSWIKQYREPAKEAKFNRN